MYLDVSKALRAPGEEFPFFHQETIPPQESFGDVVTFDEPVLMTGHYMIAGDSLRIEGRLEAIAHARCVLCLQDVAYPISVQFDEIYTHVDRKTEDMTEEFDRLAFDGSKVDLSQLAMTLAVLELPIRFECQGGCKDDSSDRPDHYLAHACQKESPTEHPFSALQQLLTKDQEV